MTDTSYAFGEWVSVTLDVDARIGVLRRWAIDVLNPMPSINTDPMTGQTIMGPFSLSESDFDDAIDALHTIGMLPMSLDPVAEQDGWDIWPLGPAELAPEFD